MTTKLPTKCQECGGKIGLFRFGHTKDEHFCSGECQDKQILREKQRIAKEALQT